MATESSTRWTGPSPVPFRLLPRLSDENRHFWTGGLEGELRFLRCGDCGYYIHPPLPVCPNCLSRNIAPEAVSGRATVYAFTVNHQAWFPGMDEPFLIAVVEIVEQPAVRLTTNIVDCALDDVHTGMAVEAVFEIHDDVAIPLFRPVGGG